MSGPNKPLSCPECGRPMAHTSKTCRFCYRARERTRVAFPMSGYSTGSTRPGRFRGRLRLGGLSRALGQCGGWGWCGMIYARWKGRRREHRLRFGHWPETVHMGMCGICAPWPCCGATGFDHKEGCSEDV